MEWAKDGHDAAFRELVRRYERPVFSLVYRMVRDRELAEDLAQETFIKVLNGIRSYRPEFKFSSWIFKIANNAAIDHLRRRELDTLSLDGSPHAQTAEEMHATALQIGGREESPLDEVASRELGGTRRRHRRKRWLAQGRRPWRLSCSAPFRWLLPSGWPMRCTAGR